MLDHAAIVEEMVRSCGEARPELAAALGDAKRGWWSRNTRLRAAIDALERERDRPQAKKFLDYYRRLEQSLQQEIDDLRQAGRLEYAGHCDGILDDLTHGRLDYRSPTANGETG